MHSIIRSVLGHGSAKDMANAVSKNLTRRFPILQIMVKTDFIKSSFLISLNAVITGFTVIAANARKREVLWEITESIPGILIRNNGG